LNNFELFIEMKNFTQALIQRLGPETDETAKEFPARLIAPKQEPATRKEQGKFVYFFHYF
jgi:hypothetical protein